MRGKLTAKMENFSQMAARVLLFFSASAWNPWLIAVKRFKHGGRRGGPIWVNGTGRAFPLRPPNLSCKQRPAKTGQIHQGTKPQGSTSRQPLYAAGLKGLYTTRGAEYFMNHILICGYLEIPSVWRCNIAWQESERIWFSPEFHGLAVFIVGRPSHHRGPDKALLLLSLPPLRMNTAMR